MKKIKFEGIAETSKHLSDLSNSNLINRIELVKDLNKGGLTPNLKIINDIIKNSKIPVYVMVRPHNNSFIYDKNDFEQILNDINFIKNETKAKGIVFGSLTNDHKINQTQLKEVIELAFPLKITFHRAIDEVENYLKEIKKLNNYKIENILTSGSKKNAIEGLKLIEEAIKLSKHNIMPGSGIDELNIENFKNLNIEYIHLGKALRNKSNQIDNDKIINLKQKLIINKKIK